jgi:POT family proton-dependent oligopeptide transporter
MASTIELSEAADIPVVHVEGLLAKPLGTRTVEIELPTNVSSPEQLLNLPLECLSGDTVRPLQHCNDQGTVKRYALQPMSYSVSFILLVELLERFSFYGLIYTQTSFLTGVYDKDWNAAMSSVEASSYVSISVAIAYTAPFLGAMLADNILGDYPSILVGSLAFYLPGLILIALTTVPGLLGEDFNSSALRLGLLLLWPVGTGIVKSILNVFGAKQFHPLLQSSLIETYYVNFYMCINIGAPAGGILIPLVAQYNITLAYLIPVVILTCGIAVFLLGTRRYVTNEPRYKHVSRSNPISAQPKGEPSFWTIFMICFLIIPFCIAYSQQATTLIVQGTVMRKAFGWIDAASMNNADAMSVLFFGYLIGNYLYPRLSRNGIKIPTTYKFAIGSALGAIAILCALVVEHKIHSTYQQSQSQICVLWQVFSYICIGMGEIFAVSTAYEVAFKLASPDKKAQASAINIFCIGGIPNMLCLALYHIGAQWFTNSKGTRNISEIEDYVEARVGNYFWVLFVICILGVIVNLLPGVTNWVASIEQEAAIALKTPMTTPRSGPVRDKLNDPERTALLKKRQNYVKYGSGPALYKQGSFRAGFTLKAADQKKKRPPKYVKYGSGLVAYKNTPPTMSPVIRSDSDPQTERAVRALDDAL